MEGKEVCRDAASNNVFPRSCNVTPCRTEDCRKCSWFPALLGCGFAVVSVFSLVLSLLVFSRTSDLQSRVSDLEKQQYTQLSALVSADQMETAILGRVDQLLEEKLKSHLPRLREARDTSVKCLCPPGPPGARGKRGHNGESEVVIQPSYTWVSATCKLFGRKPYSRLTGIFIMKKL
ncbi:collagen alpha-1(XIII) chain-like [Pseudophryne corroboree]|uniref:collagen alpha-1(XIII) chain-like n=1 Tax=Pseudophryne corroboree TaxID=495146 RepID=UPI0030812357